MSDKENKFYFINKWRGHKNYNCKHCAFATLDRRSMTAHTQIHIRGNPELVGLEVPEEILPEVDENHGLGEDPQADEDEPVEKPKETYQPKKKKGKSKKDKGEK